MDRLLQGVDEESGQPFVLFGKVRIQTMPDGIRVEDERDGSIRQYADRAQALAAVGLPATALESVGTDSPEQPIVLVRGLISEVEARSLDHVAQSLGLTREAAVRRAIAAFIVEHDED